MATCDPDGRIALVLSDRLTCLSMEMHASLDAALASFTPMLDRLDPDGS